MLTFLCPRFLCAPENDAPAAPAAPPPEKRAEGVATKTDLADLDASIRAEIARVASRQDAREAAERARDATASSSRAKPEKKSGGGAIAAVVVLVLLAAAAVVAAAKRATA